ncbi:MAG: BspA family leucine-rich repeat surface protein, partial [Synergistaceae bacterium]|nr:BspA family leucine-rich repeat surface protein [Synergistaceae bacterium]
MSIHNTTIQLSGALQFKGGTHNELATVNPFLASREIMVESDTGKIKVGDGIHYWNDLKYVGGSSGGGNGALTDFGDLVSLTVVDGDKTPLNVGDTWNYDNVRIIAEYNKGIGVDVTNQCSFTPEQNSVIPIEDIYNIDVQYTNQGNEYHTNFQRPVGKEIGTNFLPYFTYTINGTNITLQKVNATAIKSKAFVINVFTPFYMNHAMYNVVMVENNITSTIGVTATTSSLIFSSNRYTVNGITPLSFRNCKNFNGAVHIPNGQTNADYLFDNCWKLNKSVTFPDSITNCYGTFQKCNLFNQPVNIPVNVTDCGEMFNNCIAFNSPVTLPNNNTSLSCMFNNSKFNQPIFIPTNVNVYLMFMYANYFNALITFENGVTNVDYMLYGAKIFNKPLLLPDSCQNVSYILSGSTTFN